MVQTPFTRAEAQAKIGTQVRTHVAFGGVPQGAVGTITGADQVLDGYDVAVEWGSSGRRPPWVDWVTKAEYETRLVELPSGEAS
jgi:hypothetical protein